jgi:hypothetical protein
VASNGLSSGSSDTSITGKSCNTSAVPQAVDHDAGFDRLEKPVQPWITAHPPELVQLPLGGNQFKATFSPRLVYLVGRRALGNQRRDHHSGVEHDPH